MFEGGESVQPEGAAGVVDQLTTLFACELQVAPPLLHATRVYVMFWFVAGPTSEHDAVLFPAPQFVPAPTPPVHWKLVGLLVQLAVSAIAPPPMSPEVGPPIVQTGAPPPPQVIVKFPLPSGPDTLGDEHVSPLMDTDHACAGGP